jgi:hypothetical protein
MILARLEIRPPLSNTRTTGWTCENNADTCPTSVPDAPASAPACTDYTFEFAINGKITKWTHDEFTANVIAVARLVDIRVLMSDPTVKGDVEVAIRVGGNCGRSATIGLSHIYWA